MNKDKLKFLDGIRGLMALLVVVNHFVVIYYPQMYFPQSAETIGGKLALFATTPLSVFVNGNVAVQYFFVLTGFLVSRSFFSGSSPQRREILAKSCNRYLRLMPVVFMATFCTWLCMKLGLHHHLQILDIVGNPAHVETYCNFSPTLSRFLLNAFYEPFVIGGSDYVRPFWTIRYELWGYILCMLACYFLQDSRLRRLGYIAVALLLWIQIDVNFVGMLMGVFVADLCYCTDRDTTVFSRFYAPVLYNRAVIGVLFVLVAYLMACPMYFTGWYAFFGAIPKLVPEIVRAAGAAILVFCLVQTPKAAKLLESKWMLWLGEISFTVFAFHWLVMLTLQAWLFDGLYDRLGYDAAAVTSFVLVLPVILAVAWAAHYLEGKIKLDIRGLLEKTEVE